MAARKKPASAGGSESETREAAEAVAPAEPAAPESPIVQPVPEIVLRVRFLQAMAGPSEYHKPGDVEELPAAIARRFEERGIVAVIG